MLKISLCGLAIALAAISSVHAHGYVQDVVIGSTHYTGYLPYTDPYYSPPPDRIIRKIPGNGEQAPELMHPNCHYSDVSSVLVLMLR